jgi:hypothetical protein
MYPSSFVHCHPKECHLSPSSTVVTNHFKNDFGIILTGTEASGIHSTIIDTNALFILPLSVNIYCFYSDWHHSVYGQDV